MNARKTIGLLALASACLAAGFGGQTPVSVLQTPAGKHVEAYFKAFNSGEPAMRDFFQGHAAKDSLQNTPLELRLARYRQMKERLGSLELQKVVEAKASLVSVVARTGNGPVVRMDFEFEPAEPFGLLGIRVMDMGDAEEEAPPTGEAKKDDRELTAAVAEYAKKAAEAMEFSGVVLIAKNGTPIFEQAFGYADRDKITPNQAGTKFNVGSISKSFTSLAVRQLIVQKKIALDDTIGKFLPDYPNKDAAARVTVRHLLNMTSGIGDFFNERYEAAAKEKIQSLEGYLPLFADKPLEFDPGARERYSNGGYVVLGLIVQKAAGMDYYAYVRDRIFKPAGMLDSDWFDKRTEVPDRAVGYEREGSAWKSNYATLPGKGSSAGGGYSTARDLLKYIIALEKGILPGAEDSRKGGFGIAGGAPGLNAGLEWDPARGYVIAVMANMSPPSAERVARQIRAWLPR